MEIEPSDRIQFAVISSSTRVIVMPEYRPQAPPTPISTSTLPTEMDIPPTKSAKSLVRSIGTFVYSSLPEVPLLSEKKPVAKPVKPNLALVPGRHRRLFRVELDEDPSIHPTIARINRADWSEDDGTGWPHIFVAKVTVYRSNKEVDSHVFVPLKSILGKLLFAAECHS